MKIPIYEVIELEVYEECDIDNVLSGYHIGNSPYIIILNKIERKHHAFAVQSLANYLHHRNIHPQLPYPIHIVSDSLKESDDFFIFNKISDVPKYFDKKLKRLKSKELSLFNKVQFLSNKIKNIPCEKKIREIQEQRNSSKKLYRISKELHFYREILNALGEHNNG